MRIPFPRTKTGFWISLAVLVVLLLLPAAHIYYASPLGQSCARCHEIRGQYDQWLVSTHREVSCEKCHGGLLTANLWFHLKNFNRLVEHWKDEIPETIHLDPASLPHLMKRCRSCHEDKYATWLSGPHSVTFEKIFLNAEHNQKNLLMQDCLRCHGMFLEQGIEGVVTPIDTKGPWKLADAGLARQAVIPCMTCHQMHRAGVTASAVIASGTIASGSEEVVRPSLAFFDRRDRQHFSVMELSLPPMKHADKPVAMSSDPRQGLCYQCHAADAAYETGSGDDRTCTGVHEGLSCLSCHRGHRQWTRASCKECHPRLSNCGLDVETMDTTNRSLDSPHNIHSVACKDCHPAGIPPARPRNSS